MGVGEAERKKELGRGKVYEDAAKGVLKALAVCVCAGQLVLVLANE